MSALNRTGRWNPGGGHYLEMIEATSVTGYDRPNGSAVPVLSFAPGKGFSRIYTTTGTLSFDQQQQETDNGDLFTVEIRGFYPDDDRLINHVLSQFTQGQRVLARFKDYAGMIRLVGTPTEPLQLTYKFATGDDVPDSRGYSLRLSGTLTLPAAYER